MGTKTFVSLAVVGIILLGLLSTAIGAAIFACVLMLAAWAFSYSLTWFQAFVVGLVVSMILNVMARK